MNSNFWTSAPKPIVGLAPMDGVTDAAFRAIVDQVGHPSLLVTEFTNVEGIARGAVSLLNAFIKHETNTPQVAQIFGTELDSYYKATFVVCELGYDGVDINMGCPDKSVAGRGAGAGLILQPKHAQEIIRVVKQAVKDWSEGRQIEDVDLPGTILRKVSQMNPLVTLENNPEEQVAEEEGIPMTRSVNRASAGGKLLTESVNKRHKKPIPVSVKTRMGYDAIVTEDWIKNLLETQPANITLHGRTLKQLYTGFANWEEIGKAATIVKSSGLPTTILGSGDIHSVAEVEEKVKEFGVDGALIGRASFGNPWVFLKEQMEVDYKTRLQVGITHCKLFEKLLPEGNFLSMRKHLAWYCRGFSGANEVRVALMKTKNVQEVELILTPLLN